MSSGVSADRICCRLISRLLTGADPPGAPAVRSRAIRQDRSPVQRGTVPALGVDVSSPNIYTRAYSDRRSRGAKLPGQSAAHHRVVCILPARGRRRDPHHRRPVGDGAGASRGQQFAGCRYDRRPSRRDSARRQCRPCPVSSPIHRRCPIARRCPRNGWRCIATSRRPRAAPIHSCSGTCTRRGTPSSSATRASTATSRARPASSTSTIRPTARRGRSSASCRTPRRRTVWSPTTSAGAVRR